MADLNELRQKIDELDHHLIETLKARMGVVGEVDAYKKANNLPPLDAGRWEEAVAKRKEWAREAGLEKTLRHLADKLSSQESFKAHLKEFDELLNSYLKTIEYFKTLGKDKNELLRAYKLFHSEICRLADFAWAPIAVEKLIDPQLSGMLREAYSDGEEMFQILATPTKLNRFQQMRLGICAAVIEKRPPEEAAKELVPKYGWYGEYSMVEKLHDADYFINEITNLSEEKAREESERTRGEIERSIDNVAKVMSQLTDEKIKLLAEVVNEYTFLRAERVDLLKQIQAAARHLFDLIAEFLKEETGKPWTRIEVVRLDNAEMLDYLASGVIPDFDKMQSRIKFVYYRDIENELVIDNPEQVDEISKLLQGENSQTIKGAIAFKGVVRGKVSIVLSKNDLSKVMPGDILVARTTMPDYTPAMERAAAFVTEEGGITSHAAIIARELKKPCIVGTGNCTKVLKDSDEVEVDAEQGIVKIINQ